MKSVLILGLGGSGACVAESFFSGRNTEKNISFLAIDSDIEAIGKIVDIPTLCLTDNIPLGNVIEKLDNKTVSDYFPCDDSQGKVGYYKTLEMGKGANGWRMKGLLSFEYMLSDSEKCIAFLNVLDGLINKDDPSGPIEIVIISSLVGGTGSALFIPIAMYMKRYFKNRHNRDVSIKALLSCPDVYIDALTSENKVKAYANAYAALSELNAVDLVSKGYNERAKVENKCKIKLKIGSENSKGIGVLFDASKPEFSVLASQPFKGVYLFDRIPGTESIAAHERIMSKILGMIIDEKNVSFGSEIYAGISIAEVVFEGESIADYVAQKKVLVDMEKEWLSLYHAFQKENTGITGSDSIYVFAKGFTEFYKAVYTKNSYNQHIVLNREEDEGEFVPEADYTEPVIPIEYIKNYVKALTDEYYAIFGGESAKEVVKALKSKDEDVLPIRFFDTKSAKEKKLTALKNKVAYYNDILLDYFQTGIKVIRDKKDRITAALLDKNDENSLFNHFITYHGKYLHPVTVLLLLSEAYIEIKSCLHKETELFKTYVGNFDGKELPDFIFKAAALNINVSEEYAKLGILRFKVVANSELDKLAPKLTDAFDDIKKDLNDINGFITKNFVEFVLRRALLTVGELIKSYRALLDKVPVIIEDHKVDVKLALIAHTSNSCTLMNVGCTEEIKQDAYARYKKDTLNDYSRDEYTGRIFYDYIGKQDDEHLFYDLVSEEKKAVLNDKTIRDACEQNIFRVLHDRDIFKKDVPNRTLYHDFKQALSLVALPLDMASQNEDDEETARVESVTMVSLSAAEFARERLMNADVSLQQAVEQYLYLQGNCETNIIVSDVVPKNVIFSIKKIYGFPLYLFNKVNEAHENPGYYKYYKKALSVKREQDTQMWNPHLVKEHDGDFLPFIDPAKRDAFETNVYKAVFYLLQKGLLCVGKDEGNHEIFCQVQGSQRKEIIYEDKYIKVENPELLFGFIRENSELAETYGGAFDKELEKDISRLPAIGFEKTDVPRFLQAILNCQTVRFFRQDLLANVRSEKALNPKCLVDFIFDLSETEATADAINIGKIVAAIVKELVHSRTLSDSDFYCLLYNEIMKELQNEYENAAKNNGKTSYKMISKKVFSFIKI